VGRRSRDIGTNTKSQAKPKGTLPRRQPNGGSSEGCCQGQRGGWRTLPPKQPDGGSWLLERGGVWIEGAAISENKHRRKRRVVAACGKGTTGPLCSISAVQVPCGKYYNSISITVISITVIRGPSYVSLDSVSLDSRLDSRASRQKRGDGSGLTAFACPLCEGQASPGFFVSAPRVRGSGRSMKERS
jgi:hypothetical protein